MPPSSEATNPFPYAQLADELTQRGLGTAQFVTLSPRDAGNLVIYLRNARALSLNARIEPPPPDRVFNRPCVLIYAATHAAEEVAVGLAQTANRRSAAFGVASSAREGRASLPASGGCGRAVDLAPSEPAQGEFLIDRRGAGAGNT